MQPKLNYLPARPKLTEKDFGKISTYIQRNFGIKLPLSKLILVESRLIKRVIKLNLESFAEYVNYVFSAEGRHEQVELIDVICTNKTDFFREDHHFKYLEKHILTTGSIRPINIWSAACSSGEEPYTISMVLEELRTHGFDRLYSILATDISSAILQKAIKGDYHSDKVACVPKALQKKYFLQVQEGASAGQLLKKNVVFEKFNLIDDSCYAHIAKTFEYIFCRNVLIYFDQPTQLKVVDSLTRKLVPGGIIFLGHSETLLGRNFNLKQVGPTIYQKPYA